MDAAAKRDIRVRERTLHMSDSLATPNPIIPPPGTGIYSETSHLPTPGGRPARTEADGQPVHLAIAPGPPILRDAPSGGAAKPLPHSSSLPPGHLAPVAIAVLPT